MSEEDYATIEGLDLHRQSITLSGFLLDRIAEDEAAARACPVGFASSGTSDAASRHILNWPPHRVLAECEAKRRIVEDIAARGDGDWAPGAPMVGYRAASRAVLRALALPYVDHPDCREEWTP